MESPNHNAIDTKASQGWLQSGIVTQIRREVAIELSINVPADLPNADDEPAAPVPEANRSPSAAELVFERIHLLYDGMDPMTGRPKLRLSVDQLIPEQQRRQQWKNKALHGKYRTLLESDKIDTFASTAYLRSGNLFAETEVFISAIQDQVIATKVIKEHNAGTTRQYHMSCVRWKRNEYLDHIIAGCSMLAPKSYLDRHKRVGKIIHQSLREKYMGLTEIVPYYLYEPPAVCEDEQTRLYWNRKIITDRPISNNIPDIVLTLKNENKHT
ncbi:unnamed protein product [Acanthoscelides obtectus]|uniref:Uncharacterized protein n=1 Tax=Acanthoscelides obtectus TaxID=200917 RepID=A0A9P0M932_ACAOB|nr:unnamed protein product [Acanthoscelides obtectus]CAK1656872.1 hypothetical protein AOBTE_LOCUS19982 [Acanthoscelides obtectus]